MSKTKSFDFWSDFDKNDTSPSKMRKDFLVNTVKSWTLSKKISYSKRKIREFIKFCEDNNLEIPSVSVSGGKDSTVLLHLVSQFINNTKCIVAAELFHPENLKIINSLKNKEIYKPLITFDQIIKTVGFPMVSKEISQKIRAVRDAAILGKWTKACFGLRKSRKISKI